MHISSVNRFELESKSYYGCSQRTRRDGSSTETIACLSCIKQEAQLILTNPHDAYRGQSKSPNIVPFHTLGIVSSCAIVTLSLRRAKPRFQWPWVTLSDLWPGFPIFDLPKCRDLEIQVRGHSRSLKMVPFDRLCNDFLLMFFSNFVLKTHRFWDIRLQKCRDLENWVRGPSRSLEISPFDRAHATSYWRSIVTIPV